MPDTRTTPLRNTDVSEGEPELAPGSTFGRYLVIGRVGAGGSGTVYAAFDTVLDRKVALKLLGRGAHGGTATHDPRWPELVREARMLARLADPAVVTVFDVGEEDGQSFLSLEFVEGGDLTTWLARHPRIPHDARSLRPALELVLQAGRGLHAAHERGLVHGDFKPGNVLIDDKGRAKVGDFGIARLFEGDDADAGSHATTRGAGWAGTPMYMAPEQFDGHAADVQTDVYAYAVTLFQVVFGGSPFSATSVLGLAEQKASGTWTRPPGARTLRWLDRIIARGLAADRKQRYASMGVVLRELEAGLHARARGRVIAGASIAGGALAVAAFVVWPRPLSLCKDARPLSWGDDTRAALHDRFVATEHPAARETLERVETGLDAHATGFREAFAAACNTPARERAVAERAFACLRRDRAAFEALLEAYGSAVADTIPVAVRAQAELSPARACLDPEEAIAVPEPSTDEARARVEALRDVLARARAFARTSQPARALELARAAETEAEAIAFEPARAETLLALGHALEAAGEFEAASTALRQSYFSAERAHHGEVAIHASTQLVFLTGARLERHDEGLLWAEHARVKLEESGGSQTRLLSNEGAILSRMSRYDEAIAKHEQSLADAGLQDRHDLAVGHLRLGDSLRATGRGEEALQHYRTAEALWTEALGAHHPGLATVVGSIATALAKLGRVDEAIPVFERGIAMMTESLGPEHPNLAPAYVNLGIALKNAGRHEQARDVQQRAIEITVSTFGPDHRKVADMRSALGRLLTRMGDAEGALRELERARAIYTATLEPEHADHAWVAMNLGDVHRLAGRIAPALEVYRQAVAHADAHTAADDPLRGDTRAYLGRMLVDAGETGEALPLLEDAIARLTDVEGFQDILALARFHCARALSIERPGELARAIELARAAEGKLDGYPDDAASLAAWLAEREPKG